MPHPYIIASMKPHENEERAALAIETSSEQGSVAAGRGGVVVAIKTFSRPRIHIGAFVPAIRDVCRDASLNADEISEVYVSHGPGSFTGLRLGITAARTMAMACGSRLVAVPTLEAIAHNAMDLPRPPCEIAVILDAKRNHVYAQTFCVSDGAVVPSDVVAEVDPKDYLQGRGTKCGVMGGGVATHRQAVLDCGCVILPESTFRPRAEIVYAIGYEWARREEFIDRRELTPLYVRPPEAEERWEAKHRM